jgi:hypothetical protein
MVRDSVGNTVKDIPMKNTMALIGAGAMMLMTVAACVQQPLRGQEPVQNVDPARHGNIAAAQQLSREAFDRMTAAQEAHEFDLRGHAQRAKELLLQANQEMKLAAVTANH